MSTNVGNSRQYFKQWFRWNCSKIFSQTGVTIDSKDIEVCHCLNQLADPRKVIVKLSKRKVVASVMNNKKNLKSVKPQNIGFPSI